MMNPSELLVLTVHELAIAAELAIATGATQEANAHSLAQLPTLHAFPERIDAPNGFMSRNTRPLNGEESFHCAGVRVANTASLNADTHLSCAGRSSLSLHQRENAG
jgi:hypothetical protein